MNIIITNIFEAMQKVSKSPGLYNVVSILNPENPRPLFFDKARRLLALQFYDITPERRSKERNRIATLEDCKHVIAFLDKQDGYPFLVHCHAGISRSTAIVLGYFLRTMPVDDAVHQLLKIRPQSIPNAHVLELMCNCCEPCLDFQEVLQKLQKEQEKILLDKT